MTDDKLDAIEARAKTGDLTDVETNYRDLLALVAEVRRLQEYENSYYGYDLDKGREGK